MFLEYGRRPCRIAASESLDKGDDAMEKFVLEGWRAKGFMTDRQAAFAVSASANPCGRCRCEGRIDDW